MKIKQHICINKLGIDISVRRVWYGLHWYWQSIPLFDIIYYHTKCNSVHKYGIVIFGLWIYFKIDE